jgi:hypothetical protein
MPNFATIKKFATCYSNGRLEERAKLWPNPLTWEWFLGERCEAYDRKDCVDIMSVAIHYAKHERVELPFSPREIWLAKDRPEKAALLDMCFALGVWLDAWDAGERDTKSDAFENLDVALQVYIQT